MGRYTLRSPQQSFPVRCLLGLYELCASLKLAVVLIFAAALLLAIGCGQQPQIEQYRVPKPEVIARINPGNLTARQANSKNTEAIPKRMLAYDVPSGWLPGEAGGLRKAAFRIEDGDKTAEVTVIDLDRSAADRLQNVNRWRQQLELPPTTSDELSRVIKKLPVGTAIGDYVELVGDEKSILGAIADFGNQVWFFKLIGNPDLVRREQKRFESFVGSVRFATDGDTAHGK